MTIAQPVSDVIPAFDELRTSTRRRRVEGRGGGAGGKRDGQGGLLSTKLRKGHFWRLWIPEGGNVSGE